MGYPEIKRRRHTPPFAADEPGLGREGFGMYRGELASMSARVVDHELGFAAAEQGEVEMKHLCCRLRRSLLPSQPWKIGLGAHRGWCWYSRNRRR